MISSWYHCDVIVTSYWNHAENLKWLFESTFKLLLRNRLLNIKDQYEILLQMKSRRHFVISIACASFYGVPNQHRADYLGKQLHPYPDDRIMTNSFVWRNSFFPNSLRVEIQHLLQLDLVQYLKNHQRQKNQLFEHSSHI